MILRIAILLLALAGSRAYAQDVVHLDYEFFAYCYRTHDPGCIVSRFEPRDLAIINKMVVEAITVVEDPSRDDPWIAFPESHTGDCGDRSATVRQALIVRGFDPKALRFQVGRVIEPDGRELGHIVVLAELNGKTWVLDSKVPDMIYPPEKRPYPWKIIATETHETIVWKSEQ